MKKDEILQVLDEMIAKFDDMPPQAKDMPMTHHDYCALLLVLVSILRAD